jgi:surfactin synthase thioesterase subunit
MEALAARGHECLVVARVTGLAEREGERLLKDLEQRSIQVVCSSQEIIVFRVHGVEVHVVLRPRGVSSVLAARAAELVPAVILTSTDDPSQLLLETALKADGPRVVYLARTTLDVPFGPDCAYASQSKTEVLRRVDGAVGVSRYVSEYLRRWGGVDAVHVPISLMEPGPFSSLASFDNEFITLVNPCAVKGISIFLALADLNPGVRFAAVPTWGANRDDLAALRARANVTLLDPVDDVDLLFKRTRVLLVPSLWAEARSRIIPEAMLRGVPVLAADVGGIPEAMLGVDYLLPVRPIASYRRELDEQRVPIAEVPEQDVGPWQAALTKLLTDRGHYSALSRLARQKALEYAASLTVEPFESYLEAVCRAPVRHRTEAPALAASPLDRLSDDKRRLLALRMKKSAPAAPSAGQWFPSVDTTAATRLFCFPFAGAGVSAYRDWQAGLPPAIAVCPARLPGRESRLPEIPFRHMAPLIRALADAILPHLDRPFAFYGHSMGAAIAFELTRLLRKESKPLPRALVASGARAPRYRLGHLPPPNPSEQELLSDLDKLEGVPPAVRENQELLRLVLPALLADTALYRGYAYTEEPPLECPIFAYGGTADHNVQHEHVERWRLETTGDFRARFFEGGHFFIDTARAEVLAALADDLAGPLAKP